MWLDELRKKPRSVKERYAFLGASTITASIALIWAVSIALTFDGVQPVNVETADTTGTFDAFFSEAKDNVANIITVFESEPEAVPLQETNTPQNNVRDIPGSFRFPSEATTSATTTQSRPVIIETVSSTPADSEEE